MYVAGTKHASEDEADGRDSGPLSTATMRSATFSSSLVRMSMRKEAMRKLRLFFGLASGSTFLLSNCCWRMERILWLEMIKATISSIRRHWMATFCNSCCCSTSRMCQSTSRMPKATQA